MNRETNVTLPTGPVVYKAILARSKEINKEAAVTDDNAGDVLPCPFCGGCNLDVLQYQPSMKTIAITCKDCGAQGPAYTGRSADKKWAWMLWSKRASKRQ